MKKRIFSFVLMLCLLLGSFSIPAMAAEGTALDVQFNEIPIQKDLMNWARITEGVVIGATQPEAVPEEGENNRIHIKVELSSDTADGDIIKVEMNVSEQNPAGLSSALKAEIVNTVAGLEDDLYYDIPIENGKGRMTCYSYYDYTKYTTLIIDFVVGDREAEWTAPVVCPVNDVVLQQLRVWDQPVLKSYFKNIGSVEPIPGASGNHQGLVGYIWLEESVPDDAVVGLQLIRSHSNLLDYPSDWKSKGGYVQLKDGEAIAEFNLQALSPGPVGSNRRVTVYIKNHLDHSPEFTEGTEGVVELQTEVGVPYIVDLRQFFTDKDGEISFYDISVDGGETVRQESHKYRYIPSSAGQRVLTVSAYDGIFSSELCTIVLNATEDHVWGEWTVEKPATCLTDGSQSRICTCCYEKETEVLKAAGSHDWDEWIIKKNANCVEDGLRVHTCADCGAMEKETIAAGECDWVLTSSTATCGEDGKNTFTCPGCKETKVTEAPATGNHTWGEWNVTEPATCDSEGTEGRLCGTCEMSDTRPIAATGEHTWGEWKTTVAPTCIDGERTRWCEICASAQTAAIAANGMHLWNEWEVTVTPEPDTPGLKQRTCANCTATEEEVVYYRDPMAYINLSLGNKIVLAMTEVPLEDCTGKEGITVDDVIYKAHELYAPNGALDYAVYGTFITKLWGDTSGSFGYVLNHDYCWDLNEAVNDGNVLDVFIYQDTITFKDQSSYFDRSMAELKKGESLALTLTRIQSGAVDTHYTVPNAKILIDGKATDYRTDADGKVTLTFEEGGTYVISATADGYILVPPVCVVEVDNEQIKLNAPALSDAAVTATTITVTPPEASVQDADAAVEYAICGADGLWSDWQKSNLFAKLTSSATYQIRARYVTEKHHLFYSSDPSAVLTVTTSSAPGAVYTMGAVSGNPGATVTVPVELLCEGENLWKWNAALDIDENIFTILGVEAGADAANWNVKYNYATDSVYATLPQGESADGIQGEMFLLKLKIKENAAPGSYDISMSQTWNTAAHNAFWDDHGAYVIVEGRVNNGTVTVTEGTLMPIVSDCFDDVVSDTWYAEPVRYMADTGLMQGTAKDTFSPEVSTSRAMLVTMLYRMEGEPEVTSAHPFADVKDNSYYANAVKWAAEMGIIKGVTETAFAPNEDVTRQQMATILYRYAAYLGQPTEAAADLSAFADGNTVAAYAADAMKWTVAEGLIQGTGENLEPAANATRAQVAAILARYLGE